MLTVADQHIPVLGLIAMRQQFLKQGYGYLKMVLHLLVLAHHLLQVYYEVADKIDRHDLTDLHFRSILQKQVQPHELLGVALILERVIPHYHFDTFKNDRQD